MIKGQPNLKVTGRIWAAAAVEGVQCCVSFVVKASSVKFARVQSRSVRFSRLSKISSRLKLTAFRFLFGRVSV